MTDVPDGSGQIPRRAPRTGEGGAPVSGALAIVLAAVAVIAGWLILRSISDDSDAAGGFDSTGTQESDDQADDTTDDSVAVATLPTTTTTPPLVTTGATVLVANANGVPGSAGSMSRALETTAGFAVADPVNVSSAIPDQETSVVYFVAGDAAAEQVANSVSTVLGGDVPVEVMPDPIPTADGTLGDATVLLQLGNDKAGKQLSELAPDVATGDGPTTITNPPVGDDTSSG